jgi:RNA polymerase sigma-70 factor (family 1)
MPDRRLSNKVPEVMIETIYEDYFDRLYSYALLITKSEVLAKDAISEVFFNLLKAKVDLTTIKSIKSYLYTCTKNQAIRLISQNPVNFNIENVSSIDKINPEELLIGKELEEFLFKAIEDLPPQCKLVFKMVKERQMKYEEVAKELGISVDTVKYHLKTALKNIRIKMEDHFIGAKTIPWYSFGVLMIFVFCSDYIQDLLETF